MITKELLKKEIDNVREEYFLPLYKIIKTFECSEDSPDCPPTEKKEKVDREEWRGFLNKYAGCLADSPIKRGEQGHFETREELL